MARKLRIQFGGAIYHVINRGNYREDVFGSVGAAIAFEQILAQACERFGWRIHAYAIMRNHFHLVLETPQPNLVDGMHWLQGTYATRFNRKRSENGHVFQGRYRALLIEGEVALGRVVAYVHLNPVRAGIVDARHVAQFRWTSLRRFVAGERLTWLISVQWLAQLGLDDSTTGWRGYVDRLVQLASDPEEQEKQGFNEMTRGWAIGSIGWKRAIAKEHAHLALSRGVSDVAIREMRAARWNEALQQILAGNGKAMSDIIRDAKSAGWKIRAAKDLRETSDASYAWIAERLNMGAAASVRVYISRGRLINI